MIHEARGKPVDVIDQIGKVLVDVFGIFAYNHDFGMLRGQNLVQFFRLLLYFFRIIIKRRNKKDPPPRTEFQGEVMIL